MTTIAIVLATYNGAKYLSEQIESICQQDEAHWRLYIRDDGSSDHTTDIIHRYIKRDDRIQLIEDQHGNLGVTNNFNALLSYAMKHGAAYACLADQDDIWEADKLSSLLLLMQAEEGQHDQAYPVLVHSDLCVVNEKKDIIAPSFMHYQHIAHEDEHPLSVLLVQNFVTGCALMVNRALLQVALPIPSVSLMHDWWLAQCAACMGSLIYTDHPLLQYRQHGGNQVGAKHWPTLLCSGLPALLSQWQDGRARLAISMQQTAELAQRVRRINAAHDCLPLLDAYANMLNLSLFARIQCLRRYRIHSQSGLRHGLMYLRILSFP